MSLYNSCVRLPSQKHYIMVRLHVCIQHRWCLQKTVIIICIMFIQPASCELCLLRSGQKGNMCDSLTWRTVFFTWTLYACSTWDLHGIIFILGNADVQHFCQQNMFLRPSEMKANRGQYAMILHHMPCPLKLVGSCIQQHLFSIRTKRHKGGCLAFQRKIQPTVLLNSPRETHDGCGPYLFIPISGLPLLPPMYVK